MGKNILGLLIFFLILFWNFPSAGTVAAGARVIGMGGAFTAVADDSNSLFFNPAGLSHLKSWQISSMNSKLLNEIDYFLLDGVYPTDIGGFGFGYVKASLSGSYITTREGTTNRIVSTGDPYEYHNSVFLISFGKELFKNISIGTTLKLYSQGITGSLNLGLASGYNMDLGLLYEPTATYSFGMLFQNFLTSKLKWESGLEEELPFSFKIGTKLKPFGELLLVLDQELTSKQPALSHLGLEWRPLPSLTIRLGSDGQAGSDAGGGIQINNFVTAGVGLKFSNFSFDYAFHQYEISANTSHYFSFSLSSAMPF